ncbi:hypothetical protein HNR60_002218 [Rhodopseudomonas rhenobacensis]|uniref:Uncharacterized protein n=1 Tax=Rhodopseudomonas rhenobacensis TaxID=87461 RepID=A0A7W8DYZ4_9BRAD|nr:hypothetical protein [Rhodopseudomonas rhenobacensis]MBB5047463.1 hypothetical protein [Rhodopseudomonas rhenobacensis]
MAHDEPEIAATVSFRPANPKLDDKVIGDHKSGHLEHEITEKRGEAPALLPPAPRGPAPKTSLTSRLREKLEKGG